MAGNTLVAKIFYYLFVIYDRKEEPSINDAEEAAVENETAEWVPLSCSSFDLKSRLPSHVAFEAAVLLRVNFQQGRNDVSG